MDASSVDGADFCTYTPCTLCRVYVYVWVLITKKKTIIPSPEIECTFPLTFAEVMDSNDSAWLCKSVTKQLNSDRRCRTKTVDSGYK